jgi:hypothetical protein
LNPAAQFSTNLNALFDELASSILFEALIRIYGIPLNKTILI